MLVQTPMAQLATQSALGLIFVAFAGSFSVKIKQGL